MTKDLIAETTPTKAEQPKKHEFSAGDTAWTEYGEQVHVVDITVSGSYLVAPMIEFGGSYDEPPTCDLGTLQIVQTLYDKAPTKVIDAAYAESLAKGNALAQELAKIRDEIRAATAERTALLDKLKQVPALRRIEAVLDGKITHMVIERWGCLYTVQTLEKALELDNRNDHRLRLLCLFGDSKGNIDWGINHYGDGSGGNTKAWPFCSEDEAWAFVKEHLVELMDFKADPANKDAYHLPAVVRQAAMMGLEISEPVLTAARAQKAESDAIEIKRLEDQFDQIKQRIRAEKAKIRSEALPGEIVEPEPENPEDYQS